MTMLKNLFAQLFNDHSVLATSTGSKKVSGLISKYCFS
jgi:hypothetical protein